MKIKISQLRHIIREETQKAKPRIVKLEARIQQERDEFTDMMADGEYYSNWPSAGDDPNVTSREFPVDSYDEAVQWAESTIEKLNDEATAEGPFYEFHIAGIGPGGRRWGVQKIGGKIVLQ